MSARKGAQDVPGMFRGKLCPACGSLPCDQTQRPTIVQELTEALAPFAGVRDQFPQSLKLIDPKLDGLSAITVTVTKAQFKNALAALAKARGDA